MGTASNYNGNNFGRNFRIPDGLNSECGLVYLYKVTGISLDRFAI